MSAKKKPLPTRFDDINIPDLVQQAVSARVQAFIESDMESQIADIVQHEAREQIHVALSKRIAKEIPPYLDTLVFTPTNGYGEPKGTPETLKEHIHRVVRTWLEEPVSYHGKTKAEDNYNFRGVSTRGAYLVGQNIQYAMDTAIKALLADAQKALGKSLEEAFRLKLNELLAGFTVKVGGKS